MYRSCGRRRKQGCKVEWDARADYVLSRSRLLFVTGARKAEAASELDATGDYQTRRWLHLSWPIASTRSSIHVLILRLDHISYDTILHIEIHRISLLERLPLFHLGGPFCKLGILLPPTSPHASELKLRDSTCDSYVRNSVSIVEQIIARLGLS